MTLYMEKSEAICWRKAVWWSLIVIVTAKLICHCLCFSRSVGKVWPNQCGEAITSNTWPLTLTLKAWPLCLLERRRTRWSFLRVLCRSKGNPMTTLLRQAGWRNHQYLFDILWNSASSYSLKTADGYWWLHLFHTTDPLACTLPDVLPLPPVKTAVYTQ